MDETKDVSPYSIIASARVAGTPRLGRAMPLEMRPALLPPKRVYCSPSKTAAPSGRSDPSINDIALIMTSLSKTPVVWDDPCGGDTNK